VGAWRLERDEVVLPHRGRNKTSLLETTHTLKPRLARRLALPELPLHYMNKRRFAQREGEVTAEPKKRRKAGQTEKH